MENRARGKQSASRPPQGQVLWGHCRAIRDESETLREEIALLLEEAALLWERPTNSWQRSRNDAEGLQIPARRVWLLLLTAILPRTLQVLLFVS
jgi:hypothetical protein